MSRNTAYDWLKHSLRLPIDAHIANLTQAQCLRLIALIKQKFPGLRNVWERLADDEDLL